MNALILFSHGSVLCGAGENLSRIAEAMRARGEADLVAVGYLNYSEPSFEAAFEAVVLAGATHITIVPYFLVAGYFVKEKLTPKIAAMRAQFPQVTVQVAEALRAHPKLADALLNCAERTLAPEQWRDLWNVAPQWCRNNTRCPFHGTSRCPATSGTL